VSSLSLPQHRLSGVVGAKADQSHLPGLQ